MGTFRKRCSITTLLYTVLPKWLSHESEDDAEKGFAYVPDITRDTWGAAQKLVADGYAKQYWTVNGRIIVPSEAVFRSVAGDDRKTILNQKVAEFKSILTKPHNHKMRVREYLSVYTSCYVLAPLPNEFVSEQEKYQCSCPQYLHYSNCKHATAYGLARGTINVPPAMHTTVIGQIKGPGRPKKASAALVVD